VQSVQRLASPLKGANIAYMNETPSSQWETGKA